MKNRSGQREPVDIPRESHEVPGDDARPTLDDAQRRQPCTDATRSSEVVDNAEE